MAVPEQPQLFAAALEEHQQAFAALGDLQTPINAVGDLCAKALAEGKKIMLCGNGGSAADAQHIAAELTGRFINDRRPLAGLALTTDTSALTCIANDYAFDQVFSRQVEGLGCPGDVLIGISTSGNSENVIKAVEAAKAKGIQTVGLLGKDGGALRGLVDIPLIAPSRTTARIQEMHIFIGHVLCLLIESTLVL
ncbi:D-sedoheptulose 7-phosphate isomerase [Azospira inquinata]|uniref:Phosphoheptose isomerase n=1 Tax=Azospira inquinata TaxID=2785627 RepID=A0A975SKC0_9RHOO|nr:D-sedoheptulose 7-phosphate isomerase [Azospira inquinata]QWT46745.1 D-sedoheptulose 7-phosphate isomerase [Azospira inquinata]QWT47931.1 D-sedoheptulose 7-phosphate isomerase [Azospira inquinata]